MITDLFGEKKKYKGFIFLFCRIWKFPGLEVQG